MECGHVKEGESILITGAAGGVGIPAVSMAKMLGLTVFGITRSVKKAEFLRRIGVDHVITLDGDNGLSQQVKALTNGRGVDVVYDSVGGDSITLESMKSLKFGGRLLIVGWAATPNVAKGRGQRGAPNANLIPTNLIMMKSLRVIGCPAMISTLHDPTIMPRRVKAITEWLLAGKLPPPIIAAEFDLTQIKEALTARMNSGSQIGSTIVKPPPLPDLPIYPTSKL